MRLIDADELGIGMHDPDMFLGESRLYAKGWNQAIKILQEAPIIDAVEVVRCKDCKYFDFLIFNADDLSTQDTDWSGWCRYCGCLTDDFDFCSRGEGRDNETD